MKPEPAATPMVHDPWLQPWLPLIIERSAGAPVLELGCGSGADTATLAGHGLQVLALDLSDSALAAARARVPAARFLCQDLREPWPVDAGSTGVVVASLSLHYFSWPDTVALVARIHQALRPGGLLLCRLNSIHDHHYGASGHVEIEPNYYLVAGEPKRFFDAAAVAALFAAGWQTRVCEEKRTAKYGLPKALWELVLEKTA